MGSSFLLVHLTVPLLFVLVVTSTVATFEIISHFPTLVITVLSLYYLLIALGLLSIRPLGRRVLLLIVVVSTSGYGLRNYFTRQEFNNPQFVIPWREIAQEVRSAWHPGDVVISSDGVFSYYAPDLRTIGVWEAPSQVIDNPRVQRFWLIARDRGQRNLVDWTQDTAQKALHGGFRLAWKKHYVPLDPRDVRLKERILGRKVEPWNVTLYLYERPRRET